MDEPSAPLKPSKASAGDSSNEARTTPSVGGGGDAEAVVRAGVEIDLGRVEMEAGSSEEARTAFADALSMLDGLDSRAARFELVETFAERLAASLLGEFGMVALDPKALDASLRVVVPLDEEPVP